jgi:glucan phosphoethanolaminetransferase (alkaline phosphatase superfamily)
VIAVEQRRAARGPLVAAVAVAAGATLNVWLRHKLFETTGQSVHQSYQTVTLLVVLLTGLAAAALTFTTMRLGKPSFVWTVLAGMLAIVVALVAIFVGLYWPWLFPK